MPKWVRVQLIGVVASFQCCDGPFALDNFNTAFKTCTIVDLTKTNETNTFGNVCMQTRVRYPAKADHAGIACRDGTSITLKIGVCHFTSRAATGMLTNSKRKNLASKTVHPSLV